MVVLGRGPASSCASEPQPRANVNREPHGGTIVVASREGEGGTFTVRLPLRAD